MILAVRARPHLRRIACIHVENSPSPAAAERHQPAAVKDDLGTGVHHLGGRSHPDHHGLRTAREPDDPAGPNRGDDRRRCATCSRAATDGMARMRCVNRTAGTGYRHRAHSRPRGSRARTRRRRQIGSGARKTCAGDQQRGASWHRRGVGALDTRGPAPRAIAVTSVMGAAAADRGQRPPESQVTACDQTLA